MLRKMPSLALLSFSESELSSQSQTPCLMPAVSTWPGQLPTLKWNPVLSSGPAGDVTNSTYMYCEVPASSKVVAIDGTRKMVNELIVRRARSERGKAYSPLPSWTPSALAFVLTNNAERKLAQAAEFAYQRWMLIASIIHGQPVVGAVVVPGTDGPDGAGHHVFASVKSAENAVSIESIFRTLKCHGKRMIPWFVYGHIKKG